MKTTVIGSYPKPDCGLGFLPKDIMYKKLQNMIEAIKFF